MPELTDFTIPAIAFTATATHFTLTMFTEYGVAENTVRVPVIKMDEIDTQNADGSFLVHLDKQYFVKIYGYIYVFVYIPYALCIPNKTECMFYSSENRLWQSLKNPYPH